MRRAISKVSNYTNGRVPVGTMIPTTVAKKGNSHIRRVDGKEQDLLCVGLACSEAFSGPRLADILRPGIEYENNILSCLEKDTHAAPLSIHTSAGVPEALEPFVGDMKKHLPWEEGVKEDDWFINLQVEGASAVLASIDLMLQIQHHTSLGAGKGKLEGKFTSDRTKVAVSDVSYHGPGSSTFGSYTPLHEKDHQVTYQMPAYYKRKTEDGETVAQFNSRMLEEFKAFLNEHGDRIGVLLFEPQSGSSLCAQPWDKDLLKECIRLSKAKGIKIICDEIMCGLGRSGLGDLFLSKSWGLDPDAVTFGKAISAGAYPFSGCIVKQGGVELGVVGRTALQCHTYAGSHSRALMTASAVLNKLDGYMDEIESKGVRLGEHLDEAADGSKGVMHAHGMGLMRGMVFSREVLHSGPETHQQANDLLKKYCLENGIVPFHCGLGLMTTPCYDISNEEIDATGLKLKTAVASVAQELGLKPKVYAQSSKETVFAPH